MNKTTEANAVFLKSYIIGCAKAPKGLSDNEVDKFALKYADKKREEFLRKQ